MFGIYESPEFDHEILSEISANIVAKYSEGHLSLTSKTIFDITAYWPGFQEVCLRHFGPTSCLNFPTGTLTMRSEKLLLKA